MTVRILGAVQWRGSVRSGDVIKYNVTTTIGVQPEDRAISVTLRDLDRVERIRERSRTDGTVRYSGKLSGDVTGAEPGRRCLSDGGRPVETNDDLNSIAFLEAADPLLVVETESGTITAVNDAAVELFGCSRSSLVDAHWYEIHPKSDRDAYRERYAEAVAKGGTDIGIGEDDPVFVRTEDGDDVPVEIHSTAMTVGGTEYLVASVREATGRIERLRKLQRRATAMDASLTGISILNADEEYVYMNQCHADILGYDPEELLGGTWRQIYDQEQIEEIEETIFPKIAESGVWEGELVGRKKEGGRVPQMVNLTSLPDGGLICVNRDIGKRRQTEHRLEAIRERVGQFMLAETRGELVEELIAATTDIVDRPLAGYWTYENERDRLAPVDVSAAAEESDLTRPTFEHGSGLVWDAFEAGEPRYYANLATETGVYEPETPLRSEMIVPLESHGVLLVGSTDVDDFSSSERELLAILGKHATTALALLTRERELRAARDAREAERQQLRDIIDHIPHLVFAKNAAGEFLLVNEAVAEVYGTTVSELEGQTDAAFATEDHEVDHFRADDQHVLESGETVYRPEETLTDADGNERILRTWKVPFTPAGSDEDAVLGVATDITDYREVKTALERQRKLTALNRIGSVLLDAETSSEVCAVGAEATVAALNVPSVTVYEFDDEVGTLRPAGVADESAASNDRSQITPDDDALWEAFSHNRTKHIEAAQNCIGPRDADAQRGVIVVPLDTFGLLAVQTDEPDEVDVGFVETAARNLTAGLERAAQEAQVEALNEQLRAKNAALTTQQRLATEFREAQRRLQEAKSREAVYEVLLDFALTAGDDAWVGQWNASNHTIQPILEANEGGPVTVQGGTDEGSPSISPTLTAAMDSEAVSVPNTVRDTSYEQWSSRLLNCGYRSTVAIPVCHSGVIRGTMEVLSTPADGFDKNTIEYLEEMGRCAGFVLDRLDNRLDQNTIVETEVEWSADGILFPDVPEGTRFAASTIIVSAADDLSLTGQVRAPDQTTIERYFDTATWFVKPSIESLGGGVFAFDVNRTVGPDDRLRHLLNAIDAHSATLASVTSSASGEVTTFHVPAGRMRLLWEALRTTGDPQLVSKHRIEVDQARREPFAALTDRQTEVLSTAYRRGFFDQPKGVSGDELADQFDISRSTLHQHLRTAERKLLGTILDRSPDTD